MALGNGQTTRGDGPRRADRELHPGVKTFEIGYDQRPHPSIIESGQHSQTPRLFLRQPRPADRRVSPNAPFAYAYDGVGNRISKTVSSATDTYTYGASSKSPREHHASAGPTRTFGVRRQRLDHERRYHQYAYDARDRMVQSAGVTVGDELSGQRTGREFARPPEPGPGLPVHTRGRLIAETSPPGYPCASTSTSRYSARCIQ